MTLLSNNSFHTPLFPGSTDSRTTELGDQRLMQLLHHMQQLLGDHAVDTNGPLLHELFLQGGGRVFLHMLSQKQGKAYKLTKPFNGSIRIMEMFENGADIRVIDTQTI